MAQEFVAELQEAGPGLSPLVRVRWFHRDGAEWARILDGVKKLTGRTFDPVAKSWRCPAIPENLAALAALGFPEPVKPEPGTKGEAPASAAATAAPETPEVWEAPWADFDVDMAGAPYLRNYQQEVLKFLAYHGGRGIIGDEMGTGKSVSACGWAAINPETRPILVVTLQTIKKQWAAHLMRWGVVSPALQKGSWGKQLATPLILYGQTPRPIPPGTEAVVVNWEIVAHWLPALQEHGFRMIIADECQMMGNATAKRTKAVAALAKDPGVHFLPMSGTPIRTRPAQFWPVLSLIDPKRFGNQRKYLYRYCGPKYDGFGWSFKGSSNEEELFKKLRWIMLRRTVDVLDLPPKTISVVPVEADPKLLQEYGQQEAEFWNMAGPDADPNDMRNRLAALGSTAYLAKEESCIAWIREWLETNEGRKLVVFAWHRPVVALLAERLQEYGAAQIDGGITGDRREMEKEKFTHGTARVLVANILSAGVGLDGLQHASSDMAFVEFAPSPEDHRQAEARLFRSGQRGTVTVNYLIAPGTIDEDFMETLDTRRAMLAAVLDGKKVPEGDFLVELLAKRGR